MGFNFTVNPSTGYIPCKLFFGRPVQLQIGCLPENADFSTYNEYAQNLEIKLQQSFQLVREQLKKNVSRMKRDYDTWISQHNYEVGDLVYCTDLLEQKPLVIARKSIQIFGKNLILLRESSVTYFSRFKGNLVQDQR